MPFASNDSADSTSSVTRIGAVTPVSTNRASMERAVLLITISRTDPSFARAAYVLTAIAASNDDVAGSNVLPKPVHSRKAKYCGARVFACVSISP
ncbi:MAG: hypothetical protein V4813_14055 [Gemmatimonadota bacterium]